MVLPHFVPGPSLCTFGSWLRFDEASTLMRPALWHLRCFSIVPDRIPNNCVWYALWKGTISRMPPPSVVGAGPCLGTVPRCAPHVRAPHFFLWSRPRPLRCEPSVRRESRDEGRGAMCVRLRLPVTALRFGARAIGFGVDVIGGRGGRCHARHAPPFTSMRTFDAPCASTAKGWPVALPLGQGCAFALRG